MTSGRLASIQERAARQISAANPLVASALREVYATELFAAECEEHQQELARRDLQASAMFWQGEAGRLQAKLDELSEFKAFNDAGMQVLSDAQAQKILEICEAKSRRPR